MWASSGAGRCCCEAAAGKVCPCLRSSADDASLQLAPLAPPPATVLLSSPTLPHLQASQGAPALQPRPGSQKERAAAAAKRSAAGGGGGGGAHAAEQAHQGGRRCFGCMRVGGRAGGSMLRSQAGMAPTISSMTILFCVLLVDGDLQLLFDDSQPCRSPRRLPPRSRSIRRRRSAGAWPGRSESKSGARRWVCWLEGCAAAARRLHARVWLPGVFRARQLRGRA